MDDPVSPAKQLALSWVIEALATSTDVVDWETLTDLVVLIPGLGKEAAEVLALRMLEGLYDPAKVLKSGASSPAGQKYFQIHSCESFVQVLEHVMEQATLTELIKDGLSTLATSDQQVRELHTFIQCRKTSLPKYFLEQLRDREQKCGLTGICQIDVESGQLPHTKKRGRDGGDDIASAEQYAATLNGFVLSEHASRRNVPHTEGEVHEFAQKVRKVGRESKILSDANEQHGKPAQCTAPQICQQPEIPEYCSQLDACIKCKEGGEVLTCSVNNCPIVVHERCLGFKARCESKGDFLCPVCVYSRALSDMRVAKKELSLFSTNSCHGLDQPEVLSKKNVHSTRQGRGVYESEATSAQTTSKDKEPAGPAIPSEYVPSKQNGAYSVDNASDDPQQEAHLAPGKADSALNCSSKEGEKEYAAVKKRWHVKGKQKMQDNHNDYAGIHRSRPKRQLHGPLKNASCAASADITVTMDAYKSKLKPSRKCSNPQAQQEPADMKDASGASHNYSDGTLEEESCRATPKNPGKRQGKGTSPYDFNPTAERRIKRAWTIEEEEKLKEGFERFGFSQWKAILEFGRSVFQKGRTTVDVKDKWRNLTKKYPELLELEKSFLRAPLYRTKV